MGTRNPEFVLILAPYGRDAELLAQVLTRAGVESRVLREAGELASELSAGAGAAVAADEALKPHHIPGLAAALARQSSWSDFPLLLLTGGGEHNELSAPRLRLLEPLGNLTLIERPLRTSTFVSAVQTALRARRRQYQIRDHMERQQALTDAALENEAKLAFALEAARLGAWELSVPSSQLAASPQFRHNFGVPPETPFGFEQLRAAVHPDDRERLIDTISLSLDTRTSFEIECRIDRPDGSSGWIFAAGRPVTGDNGDVRLVGVTLDITERWKAEEAIRESEAQFRALADSIPQLAWMANADGHIFWYNRRWYEYTGTTFDEMAGWGWQSVHDPSFLRDVMELWRASLRSGDPFQMEFPLRSASGEYRWFLTQSRPVLNAQGEVVRWFGTNTDIDDKRRSEKALRESEELARSVIENSPDCVEVLNTEGDMVLANAAASRVLESSAAGDTPVRWAATWKGDAARLASDALAMCLNGEAAAFETSGRGADPERRWEVMVTPVTDSDGAVIRIVCISRDITDRLRAEQEMRQTAKLESLGVMAGGIAHDFNNLLTGILGNASMLRDTATDGDRMLADDIVLAAERAGDLTRQLLAYSGKGRFQNKPIDLSQLVREMLRLVRPAVHPNVEIQVEDSSCPCVLEGDPGQIQQVIMNLIINAGEAMDEKPGVVRVLTGQTHLEEEAPASSPDRARLRKGDYVFLEVADCGKGMDEATRARIFDPFFTTKFTGRGLGLAAVSGIVRSHHGALSVSTEPGKGSTFRVLFPVFDSPDEETPPPGVRSVSGQRGLILLVDDELLIQRSAAAALRRNGFSIETAGDGRAAVDVFRARHREIDAVVLDMTMPVMGGQEAIALIRQIDRSVPVIVCSGFSESEVARRFHSWKVESFLQKPYTSSMLVARVQDVLNARRDSRRGDTVEVQ